jgi:hypothetical protein
MADLKNCPVGSAIIRVVGFKNSKSRILVYGMIKG